MNLKSARHLVSGTWQSADNSRDVVDPGNSVAIDAVALGARSITRPTEVPGGGAFMGPALLMDVPERVEAGIVGVSDPLPSVAFAPVGGVKQSGLGREDQIWASQSSRRASTWPGGHKCLPRD